MGVSLLYMALPHLYFRFWIPLHFTLGIITPKLKSRASTPTYIFKRQLIIVLISGEQKIA